jgi:hypothetical protein
MRLTDTQRTILSQASQRDDGLAVPPERLPAAARQTVAKALLKHDLVIGVHRPAYDAVAKWTVDGDEMLLKITDAGLRAIGIEPESEVVEDIEAAFDPLTGTAGAAPVANTATTGGEDTAGADVPAEAAEPAHTAPTPAPRARLRDAAAAVLAAWDDDANRAMDMVSALDGPMAGLRAALAGVTPARAPRDPAAPRKPRAGTKQETVLAMLRRPEGATVAQIAEATGWAPHTVRGFFAGLKKRQGIAVEVLERVRQVGPNREGAKGSFTIYRIAT